MAKAKEKKAKEEAGPQEGLAGQASARMQDASSAAQEKASELREQGSARLRDQFDQRSSHAAVRCARWPRRFGAAATSSAARATAACRS